MTRDANKKKELLALAGAGLPGIDAPPITINLVGELRIGHVDHPEAGRCPVIHILHGHHEFQVQYIVPAENVDVVMQQFAAAAGRDEVWTPPKPRIVGPGGEVLH